MTFFSHQSAALRYARSRPNFHPLVIERIERFLKLDTPIPRALDVGCGTGQSTVALKRIATSVMGTDISSEMLAEAPDHVDIAYIRASAELLPFSANCFSLMTVGLAFHWFDRARFLEEALRVLRPGSWMVIYNNVFQGTMQENLEYGQWVRNTYLARYPTPPRASQPFADADARAFGFKFVRRDNFTNDVSFSVDEHASYLMTQSNIIAEVEQGQESAEEVYRWLVESSLAFFPVPTCTFVFGNTLWYLQKEAEGE